MNTITAINSKYQRVVNKAYKFYRSYHEAVNLDGTFNTDQEEKANARKQVKQDENYCNAIGELPKREQVNFDKQHKEIHGY